MEPKPWSGLAIRVSSKRKKNKKNKRKNLISRSVDADCIHRVPAAHQSSFGVVSEESSPLCLQLVFVEVRRCQYLQIEARR